MNEKNYKPNTWYVYKYQPKDNNPILLAYTICFFYRGEDLSPKTIVFISKDSFFVNMSNYDADIKQVEKLPNELIPYCEELFNKIWNQRETNIPFRKRILKTISYLIHLKSLIP